MFHCNDIENVESESLKKLLKLRCNRINKDHIFKDEIVSYNMMWIVFVVLLLLTTLYFSYRKIENRKKNSD
jgi:uncharacterized membrane protein affecting hemolysin expression